MDYEQDFLKKLDSYNLKEVNVRVTSYGLDDLPKEKFEGRITSGSINIDGKSSIRRSCSLSISAGDINITNYFWCLNSRINIEIGLSNNIDSNYPEIIWFPMGYFLITSFSVQKGTNGKNISLSGKDKMCLLNGELGGTFESAVTFDTDEYEDLDGTITRTKLPIKQIIRELVHTYGHEPYRKIIINDVDDFGKELQRYLGEGNLYLLKKHKKNNAQATLNGDQKIPCRKYYSVGSDAIVSGYEKLKDLSDFALTYDNDLISSELNYINKNYENEGEVRKYGYGDSCGYRIINLIYPTDLIANAGETVTSILDKLVSMLGSYEYFYDLNGNFVFQKQKKFVKTLSQKETGSAEYVEVKREDIAYTFDNNNLLTNISNNPNHMNIKNDFSIWGTRKSPTGADVPIHLRYAIDKRPTHSYTTIGLDQEWNHSGKSRAAYVLETYPKLFKQGPNESFEAAELRLKRLYQQKTFLLDGDDVQNKQGVYDWRELIYQMARDYFAFNQLEEFNFWLESAGDNADWIIDGTTGYEIYYTDIEGFWRQLYKTDLDWVTISDVLQQDQIYSIFKFLTNGTTKIKDVYYQTIGDKYYLDNPKINEHPREITNVTYTNSEHITSEVDLGNVIQDNYNLIKEIMEMWQTTESIEEKLYVKYYNKQAKDNLEEYEQYKTLQQFNEEQAAKTGTEYSPIGAPSTANLNKLLQSIKDQELHIKVKEKYLPIGIFKWDLSMNGDTISAVYIMPNNEDIQQVLITFNPDTDTNLEFLNALNCATVDSLQVGYWDDDYFPFDEVFTDDLDEYNLPVLYGRGLYGPASYYNSLRGFNKNALKNPENLNFWFDLLDNEKSEVAKYSVSSIGDRKKVVTDNSVRAIRYLDSPDILFNFGDYTEEQLQEFNDQTNYVGYATLNIPDKIKSCFAISTEGKSAFAVLEDFLYNYACCVDSISLSAIPIYYLQPNTIISINDEETKIDGTYIIEKLNYSIATNATMSITAIRNIDTYQDRKEIFTK